VPINGVVPSAWIDLFGRCIGASRVIFDQVSMYLGRSGVDEYLREASEARRRMEIPVLVMLVPSVGKVAHMTVGIPKPRLQ
jgi:hypothetical protein